MTVINEELSERELEILRLVATGASNKEIANQLFISINTVKVHLRNIFAKINVSSRTEAAMYAVNAGLVPGASSVADARAGFVIEEDTLETRQSVIVAEKGLKAWIQRKTRWWLFPLFILFALGASVVILWNLLIQPETNLLSATASAVALATDSPRWQVLASLPTARFGLAVAAYEGSIYAVAGSTGQGATDIVERYDLTSNNWRNASPKPTAVYEVSAAVIGGKVFVPGGRLNEDLLTDVLEIYDPRIDAWTGGAPMPVATSAYALVAFEGRLYLFGGWDGERYLDTVYEYDPALDSWSEKTSMNTERGYTGAAVSGGKIYVLGGYNGKRALTSNEVYLPAQDDGYDNPWHKAVSLPSGRYGMGVTSIAEIIQVVGGIEDENDTPPSLAYFPQTGQWGVFERLSPQAWLYLGVVPQGTNLYIMGGKLAGSSTNLNLFYQAIYTLAIPVVR